MPELDINRFIPSTNKKIGTGALFSHKLNRGILPDSPKTWIRKEMENPSVARVELLSQEFFRLIIPHQPETRLAQNPKTGTHYILSAEVSGYKNLPVGKAENFNDGVYTGLGQVLVGAMFLQELDLKNGNIGLNDCNQVIKIDGDWSFGSLSFPQVNSQVTPEMIRFLPYPIGFTAYNWLDIVRARDANKDNCIINANTPDSEFFRAEVNQALLKISLLPDSYIERFVDAYVPAGGQSFVDFIKLRRKELLESALQNESFIAYLRTPQASLDAENIQIQMSSFKAANTLVLPLDKVNDFRRDFNERLRTFPEIIVNKCTELVSQLPKDPDDALLNKYIDTTIKYLDKYKNIPEKLFEIKEDLIKTIASINSPEVSAVKNSIASLRDGVGLFTVGKNAKADKIEEALYRTPLKERGTVISSSESNSVQEALSAHRHPGRKGVIYKDADNSINEAKATKTFKELKLQLKDMSSQVADEQERSFSRGIK